MGHANGTCQFLHDDVLPAPCADLGLSMGHAMHYCSSLCKAYESLYESVRHAQEMPRTSTSYKKPTIARTRKLTRTASDVTEYEGHRWLSPQSVTKV